MSDQHTNPEEFWKDRIRSELSNLEQEAASNGGDLAARDLRSLKNLYLALRIEKSLAPAPTARRWPMVLVFLGTFIIVSFAFFTHPPSTLVDLDANLSEISFQTTGFVHFSLPPLTRWVSITGGSLSDADDLASAFHLKCLSSEGPTTPVSLQVAGTPGERNSISVNNLDLVVGTMVTLAHTGKGYRYQVLLTPPSGHALPDIIVSLEGRSHLTAGRCAGEYLEDAPASLTIRPGPGEMISIALNPLEDELSAPTNIPSEDLRFFKIEEGSDLAAGSAQPLSTLLSGALYLDSVGGKERKLREGERLSLPKSHGTIHILSVEKDHLHLRFTGSVADITSGESDGNATLMPTWFDWLTANHGLSTLWAAGLYSFGLVLTLLRWWRPKS